MATSTPERLLETFLNTVEKELVPLTRNGVESGSKVFGAAIFSRADLKQLTVATNDERVSPLLHGEINCIQKFFTSDFPDKATRPKPRTDCIFFATHEPCSLCLSGIAWAGFKEFYYMFTYEDTRDQFGIPYDIDILEEVFHVHDDGETEAQAKGRPLYNRRNKYFQAQSLVDLAAGIQDPEMRRKWVAETERVKGLYGTLGDAYQAGKKEGAETSSVWK